jgi:hypothetical protein
MFIIEWQIYNGYRDFHGNFWEEARWSNAFSQKLPDYLQVAIIDREDHENAEKSYVLCCN